MAEESRDEPCKRSRLWHPDDHVVPVESLAAMKNLQFLWLENLQIFNGPEKTQFAPKRKCLRLQELEFPGVPKGLLQANISGCSECQRISNMWMNCSFTELPGLGSLKFLIEMKLWGCGELEQVPTLPRGLVKARIARTVKEQGHGRERGQGVHRGRGLEEESASGKEPGITRVRVGAQQVNCGLSNISPCGYQRFEEGLMKEGLEEPRLSLSWRSCDGGALVGVFESVAECSEELKDGTKSGYRR
eukprot:Gb_07308 [translate_table: standard]